MHINNNYITTHFMIFVGLLAFSACSHATAQFHHHEYFGQSFVTADSNITFSFEAGNINDDITENPDTLVATLYEGAGFSGAELGSVSTLISTIIVDTWTTFDFTQHATLDVGGTYTVGFYTTGIVLTEGSKRRLTIMVTARRTRMAWNIILGSMVAGSNMEPTWNFWSTA